MPIFLTHAAADPRTMMIISSHTLLAFMAMPCPKGLVDHTDAAESTITLNHAVLTLAEPQVLQLIIELNYMVELG